MSAEEFNALPHIDEVDPLNVSDHECMQELRDVLEKHGKLSRFGITLLHRHFDLNEGEILVEFTDTANRVQTVEIEMLADKRPCAVETAWVLKAGASMAACYPGVCVHTSSGHYRGHVSQ
ncbi:MAG: hypothetical protein E6R12_14530 [Sphingomonadales bacterium]|nr:MAG: hypothetical protein E6R12_14530 [Sphingomonadales bacterium]